MRTCEPSRLAFPASSSMTRAAGDSSAGDTRRRDTLSKSVRPSTSCEGGARMMLQVRVSLPHNRPQRVCQAVYEHAATHAHTYTHTHTHAHTYTHKHRNTQPHTHTHAQTRTHVHTHTHTHTQTQKYTATHALTRTNTHARTHVHTHTPQTYTRAHTRARAHTRTHLDLDVFRLIQATGGQP